MTKLKCAVTAVGKVKWFTFLRVGQPEINIDPALYPKIEPYVQDGFWGVGNELASHYLIAQERRGEPVENPAQLELFLTHKQDVVTVFLCYINGKIYFSAEPLMPF